MPTLKSLVLAIDASKMKEGADQAARATAAVSAGAGQASKAADDLDKRLKSAGETARTTTEPMRGLGNTIRALEVMQQIKQHTENLDRQMELLRQEAVLTRDAITGLDTSFRREGAKKAAQDVVLLRRNLSDLAAVTTTITPLAGAVETVGTQAARAQLPFRGLIAGISGLLILRDITRTVANFDEKMAELRAVAGATDAELAALRDTARGLGATTRFTAAEAAEGLTLLAKAGFDVRSQIAAIPGVLDLAIAGGIGLGNSADIAAQALSQFRLRAEESNRVADVLVNTANRAATDVSEMAEALKFVGPVAGALKVPFEQVGAALGAMGDNGLKASLAGTGLRGIFVDLLDPSKAALATLEKLNLTLADVDPRTNDLITIFERFKKANLDASDAVRIFGAHQVVAALVLTESVEKLKALNRSNEEAGGIARETAAVMNNNLRGSFRQLRSTVEEAEVALGDKGFLGGLRGVVDTTTVAIRILLGLQTRKEETNRAAQVLAGTLRVVAVALAAVAAVKLISFFLSLTTVVIQARAALAALNATIAANPWSLLIGVLVTTTAAMWAFSDSTSAAERESAKLAESTKELQAQIKTLKEIEVERARAVELGDSDAIIKAAEDRIRQLKAISVRFRNELAQDFRGIVNGRELLDITNGDANKLREILEANERLRTQADRNFGILPIQSKRIIEAADNPFRNVGTSTAVGVVESLIREQQGTIDQQLALKKSANERTEVALAAKRQAEELEGVIEKLREERALLELTDAERETEIQIRRELAKLTNVEQTAKENLLAVLQQELDLLAAAEKARDDQRRAAEEARRDAEAKERARESLVDFIRGLDDEIRVLQAEKSERADLARIIEFENLARRGGVEATAEQNAELREKLRLLRELRSSGESEKPFTGTVTNIVQFLQIGDFIQDALRVGKAFQDLGKDLDSITEQIEFETSLIGKSNVERERMTILRELENAAMQRGILLAPQLTEALGAILTPLLEAQEKAQQAAIADSEQAARLEQKQNKFADTIANAGTDFVDALIKEEISIKDALKNLAQSVQQAFIEAFILDPIRETIRSFAKDFARSIITSSHGNVFSGGALVPFGLGGAFAGGSVIPFASGGIFDAPALFPIRGGRVGLLGEKGPEAIIPLGRDSSGRLGVNAQGGNSREMAAMAREIRELRRAVEGRRDGFMKSSRQFNDDARGNLSRFS